MILDNILKFATLKPTLFQPYIPDFYIRLSVDRAGVRMRKLDMLTLLVSEHNVQKLLAEFTECVFFFFPFPFPFPFSLSLFPFPFPFRFSFSFSFLTSRFSLPPFLTRNEKK